MTLLAQIVDNLAALPLMLLGNFLWNCVMNVNVLGDLLPRFVRLFLTGRSTLLKAMGFFAAQLMVTMN